MGNKSKINSGSPKWKIAELAAKKNNLVDSFNFTDIKKKKKKSADSNSVEKPALKQNGKTKINRDLKSVKGSMTNSVKDKSTLSDFERGYIAGQKSCETRVRTHEYDGHHNDYAPRFGRLYSSGDENEIAKLNKKNNQINFGQDLCRPSPLAYPGRKEYPDYQDRKTRIPGFETPT